MNAEDSKPTVTISTTPLPETVPVPFHGDTLFLVEHNGEPYVPMRPIVEGMGLDWKSQHVKITENPRSAVVEITTVAQDGKQRQMTCIPLRKLAGWLAGIYPNKVSPAIREKVIAYQNECDDVLYDYWTKGQAVNPRFIDTNPAPMRGLYFEEVIEGRRIETPEGRLVILEESYRLSNLLEIYLPVIKSTIVAGLFNRTHYSIMKRIRSLPIPQELHARHFDPGTYETYCGKEYPLFQMTCDGFSMLTGGWRRPTDGGIKASVYEAFKNEEARGVQDRMRQKYHDATQPAESVQLLVNGGVS